MALTLTRRESSPIPLEVFGLTPDRVSGLTSLEVAKLPVRFGNRSDVVGEFFVVTPRTTTSLPVEIQFAGDTRNVKGIGAGMKGGTIYVENNAGPHAGALMRGGKLIIDSGSGDWLGAEMSGGQIEVRRSAGSRVGAAYSGNRRGMCGGRIVVRGDAGEEVGLLMRRGSITVEGRVGEFCGASMIAGTIITGGGVGPRCGAGMKRGTIVTFGPEFARAPGFVYACDYRPAYAEVMRRELTDSIDRPINSVRVYRGDLTVGGRGEIWHIPQAV
jgi:formylmethanofuran dehydrogenase subunit C